MKDAVLCFVVSGGRVLLMRKKRGFGEGKIIAPGGQIERGESPGEAAVRETLEETGIMPRNPERLGEIEFFFGGEKAWHVHVFRAGRYEGTEKETPEGAPRWHDVESIPYGEMWIDDEYWVPLLLAGRRFRAKFFFDKDVKNILDHEIIEDGSVV